MSRLTMLRLAVASTLITAFTAGAIVASDKSAAAMSRAATVLLDSLTPDQKARVSFAFDSDERFRWHFIPNEMFPRKGLMLKDMTEPQRVLALDLLRSGLSSVGYAKVRVIMDLEDILKATEAGGRFARDKDEYLVSVFGSPSQAGNWGWRFEGHHVSIHVAVADGAVKQIASTPMFLGSNPALVTEGEHKGRGPLHSEELQARALMTSLPAELQSQALVNAVAPADILTMNRNDIAPLPPQGVTFGAMGPTQQGMFLRLIEVYALNMEAGIAAERMAKIKAAGLDKIRFSWLGGLEKGEKHYYSVQGPTFLIEYDNTQNNGNHIHSVWRDFNGDFGRDILREHLKQIAH